jgi:hypothetical protein
MAASKKPAKSNQSSVKRQKQATAGLESAFSTRTAGLDESDALYERANKKLQAQLATQNLINASLKEATNLNKTQKKGVETLTKMWGEFENIQAKYARDVKDGIMTQEQANKKLKEHRVGYDRLLASTKLNTKENGALVTVLKNMGSEMKTVEKAFDKTEKKAQLLNTAMDQFGSSNIPMMREFSDVLKGIASKDLAAVRMALTAAGAAAALLAKNYFFPEMKAAQDVENEVKQMKTDNIAEIARIQIKKGSVDANIYQETVKNRIDGANEVNRLNTEAAYASQRAANQFSATMKSGAAEFRASAKTALYGKGIGSIGYGAAQMQLAGVGAENVAASLKEATKALGTKVTSEVAADMAVLEKRTGASSESISSMVSFYKRLDGASESTALNMAEGMRSMADSAGIDLGGYMEEVASASKEALGYQIKSGPALQKQVAYAQQLGVSFGDIAKAGKSMVLNYKDSIKKEMELSAMLGRNVNLSEARALFSQGKTDEALKSIKAQGLDPKAMNMFQQEALSQALGGLDLDSIQKIATGSAKDVSAQTGNVKAGNKGFLKTTQSAQSTLASEQANIQAQQAIVDAKLSQQITEAYLTSPGYREYQRALIEQEKAAAKIAQAEELRFKNSNDYLTQLITTAKNNIENMFSKDNFATLGVGLAGALAGNVLGKGIEKLVGGVQKVFVVNSDGSSDLSDLSDGPDSKSKNKKTRTRTPRGPRGGSRMSKIFNSAKNLLPKIGNSLKPANLLKGGSKLLKGGLAGIIGGMALDSFAENQAAKGNKKMAAGADIASSALSGAGYGAMLGSIIPGVGNVVGGAVGGVLGGAYGLYQNWGAFGSPAAAAKGAPKKAAAKPAKASTVVAGGGGTPAKGSSIVLSDVQYQTRLQTKMVELLGVSAALLQNILTDGGKDKSIQLNNVTLNKALMINAKKQMAVARREVVGANN